MKKFITSFLALCAGVFVAMAAGPSISILGDSYSTFKGYVTPADNLVWYTGQTGDHTDVSDVRQTWWQLLAREGGYRIDTNNSYSGSTICRSGYEGEDYSDRAFITRMDNLGSPDILLVFGATNDSWADAPIGEYKWADWTPVELFEFRPAMSKMMDYLTNRYPNVDIRFILNTGLKPEINESVRTICGHYQVPVIELHDIHKMHGHPSQAGMRAIATQVATALK